MSKIIVLINGYYRYTYIPIHFKVKSVSNSELSKLFLQLSLITRLKFARNHFTSITDTQKRPLNGQNLRPFRNLRVFFIK